MPFGIILRQASCCYTDLLVSWRDFLNEAALAAFNPGLSVVTTVNKPSLARIREFVAADMQAVDGVIRQHLYSDVVLVRQVAEYIIQSGGKRLRPMLTVLAAGAAGYHGLHHYDLAAVVEFIHTATLLHDDVVDESALRRGNATANALFGNAASVLVGDFLYSRAFQMMVSVKNMRVMEVLADATNIIAEGEVLQLLNVRNVDINEADYLQVIHYKTAKLFEAAARLGGILAQVSPAQEEALARYGMHLGTAFQLIDDVLDYSGDSATIGKNLGDDLAEGKMTLPLIQALRVANASQAALIRNTINAAEETTPDFAAVLAVIKATDALAHTQARAAQEVALAQEALQILPATSARAILQELAAFAVERDF